MSTAEIQSLPIQREPGRASHSSALSDGSLALPWYRRTLAIGMLGALLMYAALPPLGLWPLAWIAPVPWLLLARLPALPGRRPYTAIWLAGFVFWLGILHWLRLPYWAAAFGWLLLCWYLAFYIPLFVALTRVAVHRLRISVVIAAPVVWTGLSLARGHLLGGFTMGNLEHTQYRWVGLIQVADLVGGYGLGFVIMFVAACLARMWPLPAHRWAWWPLPAAVAMLAVVLAYGHFRIAAAHPRPGPTVALIQGSIDTEMKFDPKMVGKVVEHYDNLTDAALQRGVKLDLIVWPETMFRVPLMTFSDDYQLDPDDKHTKEEYAAAAPSGIGERAIAWRTPVLIGVSAEHHTAYKEYRYNSAVFADRSGQIIGRYDKQQLVMFGEYVPFADRFPWLYKVMPFAFGITPGTEPLSKKIGDFRYAPNICYETTIPHGINGQVRQLQDQGEDPDLLVNLSNDGWFWGSSQLDLHLMCGVFRAVECRKPLLIAANTGFSAWIDANGQIVQQGPRRETGFIIAPVQLDDRSSWYLRHGDLPAGVCLVACLGFAAVGLWGRRTKNPAPKNPAPVAA